MNVASQFIELPLKRIATINDEVLSENTDPDYELRYIDIGNVDSNGHILEIVTYRFVEAPSRARRIVRDGDVIISTVRTYLQAIAPIEKPLDNLIASTGFAVVRPIHSILDTSFCKYALRESQFIHEVVNRSVGVSYPAINASELGEISICVPPLATQRAIAAYLDRETARIDALIDAKQRLLALLAEKRRALITHFVTRGLNPDVPLRDSGVPWIGKVPAHWEVRLSKWLFCERNERSTTGEEILLSLRMERGLVPHNEVSEKQTRSEELIGYKKTSQHEIVLNRMRAASGLVAVSPQEGLVSPDYAVFQALPGVNPYYYSQLFRTELLQAVFRSESTGLGTGSSGFLRLYSDNFLSLWFPYPSWDEQKDIVTKIDSETQIIDNLKNNTQYSIDLLHERRTALIAAAVTGQINVTG